MANIKYETFENLEHFMKLGFMAVGVKEEHAAICAKILIESDKRGIDSHGVGRFKPIYIDRIEKGIQFVDAPIEVVRETKTTAVIDGNDGMGHVISHKAMEMAIEKAKIYGMGMVAVRSSTHYGIAGYYTIMAANAGMIGITGTNARPSIAPTFGVQNMLGTNPLTFGFPTDEAFPFVIDAATSITQRGKIEHYARINKTMPYGWVIDENGNAITDPKIALDGLNKGTAALTPLGGIGEDLGGYKGYGLATVVEVLSAALQGGMFLQQLTDIDENGNKRPYHLGHFFIAIDIEAFTSLDAFKKTAGDILRALRNSTKAKGEERIYTAGEKEYLAFLERSKTGVPLNEGVINSLIQVRDKYQINFKFSFEE